MSMSNDADGRIAALFGEILQREVDGDEMYGLVDDFTDVALSSSRWLAGATASVAQIRRLVRLEQRAVNESRAHCGPGDSGLRHRVNHSRTTAL
jgi:hypothetical protein